MASLTGVGDNVELQMTLVGDTVSVAISGTYDMTIELQRERGSPGSGAWERIKSYTTAHATVAETYTTKYPKEKLRLVVTEDTSGTATATLTDSGDKAYDNLTVKSPSGQTLVEHRESGTAFFDESGNRIAQFGALVSITADLTVDPATHLGRPLVFNSADGDTVTLPAATGTGHKYEFFVGTTVTSNNDVIQVANATDIIQGVITGVDADAEFTWGAATDSDTISLGGTSNATGGTRGDSVILVDIASGVWSVRGNIHQGGTEATPFSAAVS